MIHFTLPDADLFDAIFGRYHSGRAVPSEVQPGAPAYTPVSAVFGNLGPDDPNVCRAPAEATR